MIDVRGLTKHYVTGGRARFTAVDGLSLRVEPGEVYGLIGPNGAGKTTTLKVLATLLRPDAGTVWLGGVDVLAEPLEARRRLAWVPAEVGLPAQLTPFESVRLFGEILGVPDAPGRASMLLDRLGAASYMDVACSELSTGMKRRVILARALMHDPAVLLLDEPTDGLDVPGRRDVLSLVREVADAGKTVILSSHVMSEVERASNRLGVVARGRVVAEGTAPALLAQTGCATLDDAFVALTGESAGRLDPSP
jgi:ABC-type multidrug transport system ATPase subunit